MNHLKKINFEIIFSVALIIMILCLLNPFRTFMTEGLEMFLQVIIGIFGLILVGIIWKERVHDEREQFHRMISSRAAFITGELGLIIAIIVQTFQHNLDGWLVFILGSMVVAKLIARSITDKRL